MPSHLTGAEIGLATKSDGSKVNLRDLWGNRLADGLAKRAVEVHRVDAADVRIWRGELRKAEGRAKWIGTATHEANNHEQYPFRNSEAAKWRAETAKRNKLAAAQGGDGRRRRSSKKQRAISLREGGHDLEQVASGNGWFCYQCKARAATKGKLASQLCQGGNGKKWAGLALHTAASVPGGGQGKNHSLMRAGSILWCGTCGCFAETRASGLAGKCTGTPPAQLGSGGRKAQLTRLQSGLHPVTLSRLPAATWANGDPLRGEGKYSRLKAEVGHSEDPNFKPYLPIDWPSAEPSGGKSASEKTRLRHGRIKCKEASERRAAGVARRRAREDELQELIATFIGEPNPNKSRRVEVEDRESEAFWMGMDCDDTKQMGKADIFRHISNTPRVEKGKGNHK